MQPSIKAYLDGVPNDGGPPPSLTAMRAQYGNLRYIGTVSHVSVVVVVAVVWWWWRRRRSSRCRVWQGPNTARTAVNSTMSASGGGGGGCGGGGGGSGCGR